MPGPFLSSITNTFFVNLINRLGVRPPPPDGFDLINTVQPVTIVDSDISIPAILTTQLLDAPFSGGLIATPAAGAVLADTGQLPVGTYLVLITAGIANLSATGADIIIARRNAANAADVWRQCLVLNLGVTSLVVFQATVKILANERIRVTEQLVGSASVEVNIWVQQIT